MRSDQDDTNSAERKQFDFFRQDLNNREQSIDPGKIDSFGLHNGLLFPV